MKSWFLTESEKKDVIKAAQDVLRMQHPDSQITITVEDETDDKGVPRYKATITPLPKRPG